MKNLGEDLEFQTAVSFSRSAFHQARFTLLDTVASNSKYHFSDSSKAIIATIFEQCHDWSHEVYQAMRGSKSNVVDSYVMKTLTDKFRECSEGSLTRARMLYPDIDSKLAILVMVVTKKYHEHLVARLVMLMGTNTLAAFSDLNNFLIQYMHHIRIVMHEMDHLLFQTRSIHYEPFLVIDRLDTFIYEDRRVSLPAQRLATYMESSFIKKGPICVKTYIDSQSLESEPKLNSEYEAIIASIEELGMEIVCIL